MGSVKLAQRLRGGRWERLYRDAREFEIPWEAGRPSPDLVALVRKGEVTPGRAVDIGCGLGTNALYLAHHGFQVWALDIAPTALRRARRRARLVGAHVNWLEGDARQLPLSTGSVDFAYDRGCMHHLDGDGPQQYAAELARVLRSGGRFQLLAFTSRYEAEELIRLFERDFRVLEQEIAYFQERQGSRQELHSLLFERKGSA